MAEVLSQSQIDALLSSMQSGEDVETKTSDTPEENYRKYDFYSPKKFTKDRLKILQGVYDGYCRSITARLNSMMRTNCELTVDSIEEQRYYEFINAISDNDVLTIIGVSLPEDETENTPVILHATTEMMLFMMDRMLGSVNEKAPNISYTYNYTSIELQLYESILSKLIDVMGEGWQNYLEIHFALQRVEQNPTLMQVIGIDETVVIVGLNVTVGEVNGRFSICLPGTLLTSIFNIIARSNMSDAMLPRNERDSAEIMDSVRDSGMQIIAELGQVQLSLSDIYYLHEGDVINLAKPKDSDITLYVEGEPWFIGKLGTHKNKMAVKIDGVWQDV